MKREDMIEEMINFYNSTPEEASDYHTFDMLLSRMERLGMKPPCCECFPGKMIMAWEDEDEYTI